MYKNYNWLPDFVYGSTDGIITTFAVVSAVEGGGLAPKIILIMGFANLLADGFSMATSKYLSDKAELDQDLEIASAINPLLGGAYTFLAFIVLGSVPLLAYVLQPILNLELDFTFSLTIGLTLAALFFVGFLKGHFVAKSKLMAGLTTMSMGAVAALISYNVGFYIESLFA